MQVLDKITFKIIIEDAVIGWDLETNFYGAPKAELAAAKIVDIVGIDGLEKFLDHAMAEEKKVEISMTDMNGIKCSIKYDPWEWEADKEQDVSVALFLRMLDSCIEEYKREGIALREEKLNGKPLEEDDGEEARS